MLMCNQNGFPVPQEVWRDGSLRLRRQPRAPPGEEGRPEPQLQEEHGGESHCHGDLGP